MDDLLATKLFIPSLHTRRIPRPDLVARLNAGLDRKLTLLSAPAGFGKTTLAAEWAAGCGRPAAWLSLDEEDRDPQRFLSYLVAALQKAVPGVGETAAEQLRSPQPPAPDRILTSLINEITGSAHEFLVVLDDYHLVDSDTVDRLLIFLLEHQPPGLHLAFTTRADPPFPLARMRARGQLAELRAVDLRFTHTEAADFLNRIMGFDLSGKEIAALESRTEGWIAGLQLAALSMKGHPEPAAFIRSFSGSHQFVLDYLMEEVLLHQTEDVQSFLLQTSILDRLCGPLCDAMLPEATVTGQQMLEELAQANLFLISLDNERRWYRYHHLFAELLRQRLHRPRNRTHTIDVPTLHVRASTWFEDNDMPVEAFRHAAAAEDHARAERLLEGGGMPLQYRGALAHVLNWLETLPDEVMDIRPSLWVTRASTLTMAGRPVAEIEDVLQRAETALQKAPQEGQTLDLIGHVAAIRAMLAVPQNRIETIFEEASRALEYLSPNNLPVRTTAAWTLGYAHQHRGETVEAIGAFSEALTTAQKTGNTMISIAAATSLGQLYEVQGRLGDADASYREVLLLAGDPPLPAACEAHVGLGRVYYEWNRLAEARAHCTRSFELARQIQNVDTPVSCMLLLARLELAVGDTDAAAAALAEAAQFAETGGFAHRRQEIAAGQVRLLLRQRDTDTAARLLRAYDLPRSRARLFLAKGDPAAALAALQPHRQEAEASGAVIEWIRALLLEALARQALGEKESALAALDAVLESAFPGGFLRIFLDEGPPMAILLAEAAVRDIRPNAVRPLLSAFRVAHDGMEASAQPLVEPLSERELEVLQLIAQGLSNRQIGEQLFLALDTVKGHNRNIFQKLQVRRRTEAVARARELGLL